MLRVQLLSMSQGALQVCEPCASLQFADMGALDAPFEIVRFSITAALITLRSRSRVSLVA
jgi:hypothetical protein